MKKGAKLGRPLRRHGLTGTPEFAAFRSMEQRVRTDPRYGGLGIEPAWVADPRLFVEHIGPKPSPKHEVDRIDNSKGYVLGNVRWATSQQQKENRSNTRWIEHNGKRQTIAAWARELGLGFKTIKHRIEVQKLPLEEALVAGRRPSGRGARARQVA